jgi:hypothetical protein
VNSAVGLLRFLKGWNSMPKNSWLIIVSVAFGLVAGLSLNRFPQSQTALAQNATQSNQILVQGHGRAVSRLAPPGERIELIPSTPPQRSFTVVPAGKKFVLTDVMYQAQVSVRQPVPVNIGNANLSAGKHDILFQFIADPMKSDQVHLCSGYVIPAGNSLVAWTGYGPEPEQFVSIAVTGYLADQ